MAATLDKRRITKRKKEKIRYFTILTFIELLFSLWFSSVIDNTLKLIAKGIIDLNKWMSVGFVESIKNLFINHNVRIWFFVTQVVYAFVIYKLAFRVSPQINEVETMEITPNIEIPVPAGNGQHGSERFLTEDEKEELFSIFEYDGKNKYPSLSTNGGLVVQMTKQGRKEKILYVSDEFHSIILGASGSGKTRRILLQTLWLQMISGMSVVLSDVKGEIYYYSSEYAKKIGYEVIPFDLRNPKKSVHYNFLQPILDSLEERNQAKAIDQTWDLVSVLVGEKKGEPIWHNGECATIAAAILVVAIEAPYQYKNLTNVYYFLNYMCQPDDEGNMPLNYYLESLDDTHPAKGVFGMATIAADKTRASFFTSALGTLKIFTNPNVADMTSSSDFKLKDVSSKKTILYMMIPDEKDTLYPLVSILVTQLYQAQVELANESGLRVPVDTDYDLDEFGNFPTIPCAGNIASAGRSRGIRMHIVLQDYQQLEKKYKDDSENIKTNCQIKIYLKSDSNKTLKEISESLGKYTVEVGSASTSVSDEKENGMNYSSSSSLTGRNLMEAAEIRRIKAPFALCMPTGEYCGINKLPDLSQWHLNKLLGLGNKEYNAKIIKEREQEREERDIPPISLWGIWNEYIVQMEESATERVTFL